MGRNKDCTDCWTKQRALLQSQQSNNAIILIDGPQGSGKTTISSEVAARMNLPKARGFPTGQEIMDANGDQARICSASYRKVIESEQTTVFDRSPISQTVWMARSTKNPDYITCLADNLSEIARKRPVHVVLLDSTPELCLARQDSSTPLSIKDTEKAQEEIATYRQVADTLKKKGGNLHVHRVVNDESAKVESLTQKIINLFS